MSFDTTIDVIVFTYAMISSASVLISDIFTCLTKSECSANCLSAFYGEQFEPTVIK